MTGELFINGKDAYTMWGLSLEPEGLGRLMKPSPHKQPVTNSNVTGHGAVVIPGTVGFKAEETVNLPVHIVARTKADFWAKFNAFCSELNSGTLTITTAYQSGVTHTFIYQDCQNFTEFIQHIAKFDLVLYKSNG